MIDLSTYFLIPFKHPEIDDLVLSTFAQDHINKLKGANQDGIYDELIDHTLLLIDGLSDTPKAKSPTFHDLLTARDHATSDVSRQYKRMVRKAEGLAQLTEETKGNSQNQEPQEIEETFSRDALGVSDRQLNRAGRDVKRQYTHGPDKPSPFELHTYIPQDNLKTKVREALEIQLTRNLLLIAMQYPERPDLGLQFYNLGLLRKV